MAGRLSIDFGTCNTVIGLWDAETNQGQTLPLVDLSIPGTYNNSEFHIIPSLINYDSNRIRVGKQVIDDRQNVAPSTFYWIKTYIGNGMKLPRRINGQTVDFFQAGSDFLKQLIIAAGVYVDFTQEEVAFTLPVEAFEHYQNWLDNVAIESGVHRPLFIDEPSAAALGYNAGIRSNEAFMVFDFGGGSVDVTIVKLDDDPKRLQCRLLGKSGAQVGGSLIDQWIVLDIMKKTGRPESQMRSFMMNLLCEAERVKKALSSSDLDEFNVSDPSTGENIRFVYTRCLFEDLLEENGLFTKLNSVMDMAEAQAAEYGYNRSNLRACLMIGGSGFIPSVRRLVRSRYGELTRFDRPFDAVALGAAAYAAGADFNDRVRHEYAIRPYDRKMRDYVLKTIVPSGTLYPCRIMNIEKPQEPLVMMLKASNEQQTRLGLKIHEVARKESAACGSGGFELVFTENGSARYTMREDVQDFSCREIGSTTFITADPPAKLGDPRFLASFSIDFQKRLCVTVRDIQSGKTLMSDCPMVKLT